MEERILKYVNFMITTKKKRDKRFEDFHNFHKWCLENIPQEIWSSIPTTTDICCNDKNMGLDISVSDYNWWASKYDVNPNILMFDIKIIKEKFLQNLAKTLNNYKFYETRLDKDDLSGLIKLIDDTYQIGE